MPREAAPALLNSNDHTGRAGGGIYEQELTHRRSNNRKRGPGGGGQPPIPKVAAGKNRRMILGRGILGLSAAVALAAAVILIPPTVAVGGGPYVAVRERCCGWLLSRNSALDAPLRPYFVPRCPAWGGHDFCYRVDAPKPCLGCPMGPADGECCPGSQPYPPELACIFDPAEFQQLGQIPNDYLLEAAANSASR